MPLKDKFAIINHSDHFYEKSLRNFAELFYLSPDVEVIYEARKFKLQLKFIDKMHKIQIFTFEKSTNSGPTA